MFATILRLFAVEQKIEGTMIWSGQYNAVLVLLFLAGVGVAFMTGEPAFAIAAFVIVVLLRLFAGIINLLFKAFLGKPLIYDTKIMTTKNGGGMD